MKLLLYSGFYFSLLIKRGFAILFIVLVLVAEVVEIQLQLNAQFHSMKYIFYLLLALRVYKMDASESKGLYLIYPFSSLTKTIVKSMWFMIFILIAFLIQSILQ